VFFSQKDSRDKAARPPL